MTGRLRLALAELEKLPESAQDEAAARIEAMASELAERRWDEVLVAPRSERFFDQMAAQFEQAKREDAFRPLPSTAAEQQ
jgi:DnaJ-domain-containing protein 1